MFDIQLLDTYREDNRLEAKKARGGLPHSLWETYSAFANTDGGLILIGADEKQDGTLIPTGLTEDEVGKMKKQFWDIINNRQKVSDNILTDKEVYPEKLDGSVILVVNVPRAQRERRPVYINGDIFSGTYKRNSSGDYHCTKDEVRSMLRDQGSQTVDTKILTGMNLSVLNPDSILAFRMNHRNTQLNHPWSNLTDKEFLIRIGAAAISDTDGKAHPTGAGLLMFGNEYEIVREYPNYFLDFREMVNDITEWTDRIALSRTSRSHSALKDFTASMTRPSTKPSAKPLPTVSSTLTTTAEAASSSSNTVTASSSRTPAPSESEKKRCSKVACPTRETLSSSRCSQCYT